MATKIEIKKAPVKIAVEKVSNSLTTPTKTISKVKSTGKIITAGNGIKYEEVAPGKLRKVTSLTDIKKLDVKLVQEINKIKVSDFSNKEVEKIAKSDYKSERDYNKMTVDLYRFFKDREENTVYKKGVFIYRAYKVWFSENGINVIDYINYSKKVETGLKGFPKYEKIFNVISSLKGIRKTEKAIAKEKEVKVNPIMQRVVNLCKLQERFPTDKTVRNIYSLFLKDKSIDDSVKADYSKKLFVKYPFLLPKDEVDLVAVRKKAISMVQRTKMAVDIKRKLHRLIPVKAFSIGYGKVLRKFDEGEIRFNKFKELVLELLRNDLNFEDRKVPAGMFICKPAFTVNELVAVTDTHVEFINKTGLYKISKSTFMAYYLLHHKSESLEGSKLNVAIAKYLNKDIDAEEVIEDYFMRDRFVILDYKNLPHNEHNEELYQLLIELMFKIGICNPLEVVYSNQFTCKVGDKLKCLFNDFYTYLIGTVTRIDGGIFVRYPDGEVLPVMHYQKPTIKTK